MEPDGRRPDHGLRAAPQERRNYVRLVFTHPALRTLYADWEDVGRLCVAFLHMDLAKDPEDPCLAELVRDISAADEDFRAWWHEQHVALKGQGVKRFHHPVAGELTLDWDTLTCATTPDQQVIALNAEPGSPSDNALRLLAAWAEENLPHVGPLPRTSLSDAQPVPWPEPPPEWLKCASSCRPLVIWDKRGRPSRLRSP